MAGWVCGITEVRRVEVPIAEDRRGPVMFETKREIVHLPPECWARLIPQTATLPIHVGAGPCGTVARWASGRSYAAWWARRHLLEPIRRYYATYVPPMRFGAKSTPRGRRVA